MNKRGQLQISFGVIFSVILIIAFVAVAIYAISFFLDMRNCSTLGLFKEDLQEGINRAWKGDEVSFIFQGSLPSNIDKVCFVNPDDRLKGQYDEEYEDYLRYKKQDENLFFFPISKACKELRTLELEHLNIEGITANLNPYCINANKQIEININKDFDEVLVSLEKTYVEGEDDSEDYSDSTDGGSNGDDSDDEQDSGDDSSDEACAEEGEAIGYGSLMQPTRECCEGLIARAPEGLIGGAYCIPKGYEIKCLNIGTRSEGYYAVKGNDEIRLKFENCGNIGKFCGSSTLASCSEEKDCKTGGCSGQVCEGKDEDTITICVMRDCYNAESYGLECGCDNNECKWH